MELRPYQAEAKRAILSEWSEGHRKTLLVLPTGCHAKGEKLLLANGRSKKVEDITAEDKLLGSDGKVRNILFLHRGEGELYKVTPIKGEPFIVTPDHKLTLVPATGELLDVPVAEWLRWPESRKEMLRIVRADSSGMPHLPGQLRERRYALRTGFTVEPAGHGKYYGFTVDGDNRYLLSDFTITHNCGKTIVFASVTAHQVELGHRVLIIAHRGELLAQAADKLKAASDLDAAFEQGESHSLGSFLPVTVGSVQSLCQEKRLAAFPQDYFQDIIVDEAHHCLSDSYQRVLEHFPEANILGVTATPDRGDKQTLGKFFDSQAYEYSMSRAIREGYLSPVKARMIPLKLDISQAGISGGDYSATDIGYALEPYLTQIAKVMAEHCRGRKTVVFLPLIATSQKFCRMLNEVGLRAAEVNGMSEDRSEILTDFENGKYDVLCNSMLLTEGWDCPAVDCIVVLRPTKVRSLYQQMVGRGMRLFPGKENLLLLDFLWLTERHDLCKPSSLIAKDAQIAEAIDEKIQNDEEVDILEAEEEAERDVLKEREEALARELAEMRSRAKKLVDPIQYALSIAAEDLASYTPTFPWEMDPPSEKQLSFLEKRGILPDTVENAGLASLLIDRLKRRQEEGLATPKQIRCLERYGFRQVGTWQFDAASNLISRLAMNHWRVPQGITPAIYTPMIGGM